MIESPYSHMVLACIRSLGSRICIRTSTIILVWKPVHACSYPIKQRMKGMLIQAGSYRRVDFVGLHVQVSFTCLISNPYGRDTARLA